MPACNGSDSDFVARRHLCDAVARQGRTEIDLVPCRRIQRRADAEMRLGQRDGDDVSCGCREGVLVHLPHLVQCATLEFSQRRRLGILTRRIDPLQGERVRSRVLVVVVLDPDGVGADGRQRVGVRGTRVQFAADWIVGGRIQLGERLKTIAGAGQRQGDDVLAARRRQVVRVDGEEMLVRVTRGVDIVRQDVAADAQDASRLKLFQHQTPPILRASGTRRRAPRPIAGRASAAAGMHCLTKVT